MKLPGSVRFRTEDIPPGPDTVLGWYPESPGLYLHVPFCSTICPFCPYNKVRYERRLVDRYFTALTTETAHYAETATAPFGSLYIGGGTPTLCLDELSDLLARLPTTGERAIEVLPNHMTVSTAEKLAGMGVTHLSLGVQSFDRGVLRHLRRPNTTAMNRAALEVAVGSFECVDVDLIFDVGFDDPATLLSDLRSCFEAGVDQVSTYPLMRFGYTPFGKTGHDRRSEHRLLRRAAALAEEHGYQRRSVWTFNRPGGPVYTSITREFYLGLGAGAASYTGRLFLVNHFGIDRYIEKVSRGLLPVARLARMSPTQGAAYYLFWQMYAGGVDVGRFHRLFGSQPALTGRLLGILVGGGLARRRGRVLSLRPAGYDRYHDLERWVTYHLIEPLWAEMMKEHEPADPVPVTVSTSAG